MMERKCEKYSRIERTRQKKKTTEKEEGGGGGSVKNVMNECKRREFEREMSDPSFAIV